jgi:lysophospholipase L1-like esterase
MRISGHLVLTLILIVVLLGCGGTGGSNNAPQNWSYVALGDSLAFGALAQQGYVPRYADDARTDTGAHVTLVNLAVPGWHTGDLLNALNSDPALQAAVRNAQVVTWDIGGNDLANAHNHFAEGSCGGVDNQDCLRAAVTTMTTNWDAIMAKIVALTNPQHTIVRTMDIYNPFVGPDTATGVFDMMESKLDQVNAHIHASAAANGIPVAEVHHAFNGADGRTDPATLGLLAVDGFHPNDNGHKIIADQLRALGYTPLH